MKLPKNKKTKKIPFALILSALLLVVASVGTYAYIQSKNDTPKTSESSPAPDLGQSQNLKDNPNDKQQPQNTDKPPEPEAVNGDATKQRVKMEASSDKSNDTLFIRGGINYPVSGGRCFATLTGPSGQIITKNTELLQGPASTDCQTISISISELIPGNWSFKLQYESDKYTGTSANGTFSI